MKYFSVVCVFTVLLVSSPVLTAIESEWNEENSSINNKTSIVIQTNGNYKSVVDGTTSASKLRAKKSHSVSKQDEMGLTIFFGVIVLSVIVFFLKPFSERK